jgi:hypothetical protein
VGAGLALAATSLLGILLPGTSSAAEKVEPAKVEREAYFTAAADGVVPATITNEFPPGVVCIVVPQACSTQTAPVTGPVGSAVKPVWDAAVPDYQAPQPVEAGTLPVGMLGGKPRHTSYMKFALPTIPTGSLIGRFDLVLSQTAVSYALESPAFRQAVLAGLVTYQTRSPGEFTKFIGDVASQTTPLARNAPTGIELCAVTTPWTAVKSGDATKQPKRDCIFGANGIYDATAKTWTFDLSLLAQAWLDGTTPNEGVYLGPIGAENLAFGDQDTSTNWQVSVAASDATDAATRPRLRYDFTEGFTDAGGTFADVYNVPTADTTSADAGVVPTTDLFSVPVDDTALTGGAATRTSTGGLVAAPRPALRATLAAQSHPRTPWWLWLLLPLGLVVAYGFSRSLDAEPPSTGAARGALTRLMAVGGDTRPPT